MTVGLLAADTLDVHDVFETVDGGDLALATLVGAPFDDDLVVLADGNGADLDVYVNFMLCATAVHRWYIRCASPGVL